MVTDLAALPEAWVAPGPYVYGGAGAVRRVAEGTARLVSLPGLLTQARL